MRLKGLVKFGSMVGLCFALTAGGFAQNTYVPSDLALGGGLDELKAAFDSASSLQAQIIIAKMIAAVDSEDRYEVLRDIFMEDLKSADIYGMQDNVAPEARRIAIAEVGESGQLEYATDYISVLQYDDDVETRLSAAEALGKIKDDSIAPMLVTLLTTVYSHENFKENNDEMYNDDLVAEGIIIAMGEHGSPRYFTALLEVVTLQNHRDDTIDAAWNAMENLKW